MLSAPASASSARQASSSWSTLAAVIVDSAAARVLSKSWPAVGQSSVCSATSGGTPVPDPSSAVAVEVEGLVVSADAGFAIVTAAARHPEDRPQDEDDHERSDRRRRPHGGNLMVPGRRP